MTVQQPTAAKLAEIRAEIIKQAKRYNNRSSVKRLIEAGKIQPLNPESYADTMMATYSHHFRSYRGEA